MSFRLLIFAFVLFLPSAAKADFFYWQDEKTGLSMTFPDTWKMQTNANPDTIMTIMGPSEHDQPTCRVDVRDDKRYTIYPSRYGDAVQKVAVSEPFWRTYLGQYDKVHVGNVVDGAALGRWYASYALASYARHFGTVLQQRKSIMFASLYRDKLYVVECSALALGYERWEADFRSIVKSIDFKKAYHELPTGEYANFLRKSEMYFWSQTGPEGTIGY